ncbi:MAG: hypothetical protein ACQEU4_05675 [Bacillota bacterium]
MVIYVAVAKLASLESEGTNLGVGTVPPVQFFRWARSVLMLSRYHIY